MHLKELLALRPVPAGALFMALTRRCPLACAHCSTNSLLSSEQHAPDLFLRFVDTFSPDDRPEVLLLTGGEPLLRPQLVRDLTERAHAVGTRVSLISGMFFARQPRVPAAIDRAIAGVDHFTASLDIFHEQQVPRAAVFRVFRDLLARGQDVSFQVTGLGPDDPYLADVTADIRRHFADRVPVLVAQVGAVGRAREWLQEDGPQTDVGPAPCAMAAWPTVTFDGAVVACCNQTVVDGPAPPHLRLGHVAVDTWATVRERCLTSTMLRAIRVFGPLAAAGHGSGKVACDGYCATCYRLSDDPTIAERLAEVMARPAMGFVEQQVVALQQGQRAYGVAAYAPLAELGYQQRGGEPAGRPVCAD